MEEYAAVLNFAIPLFVLLIVIEHLIGKRMGVVVNRSFDTISSISSGMTNIIRDVLGLVVVIVSYGWMVDHFAVFSIESSFALYLLAFIGKDFAGYWTHRFEHVVNIFWNRHIIHHSSEEFNLACALRQNVSAIFGIFFVLYLPMAILGVPAEVVAIVAPIHLFAQFWYHTRLIDRMGWLEYIIVTPSHHRVHHAINDEYLDRNFGQIFIIWDKLFGTFQEELRDVPAVYGVKKAAQTWNPIIINYQHFWQLVKDAWRTQSWWDKLRIWFMPTGWRPADVNKAFPVDYTRNPYTQKKYETKASPAMQAWVFMQFLLNSALMMYLFNNIAAYSFPFLVAYGIFLIISIFGYTSLMDGSRINLVAEALKLVIGVGLIIQLNGWYGIDQYLPMGTAIVVAYLLASMGAALYFTYVDKPSVVWLPVSEG